MIAQLELSKFLLTNTFLSLKSYNKMSFYDLAFSHSDTNLKTKVKANRKHACTYTHTNIRNMYVHTNRLKNIKSIAIHEVFTKRIVPTYFQSGWVPYWPLSYCSSPSSVRQPTNNSRLKQHSPTGLKFSSSSPSVFICWFRWLCWLIY